MNPLRTLARGSAAAALVLACNASAQIGVTTVRVDDMPVLLTYATATPSRPTAFGPFELNVAVDAEPAPGARRLIVMSHGTGGSAVADHTLAATLAGAGFVVAQPLHAGDNYLDTSRAGPSAWDTRPKEVSRVIDALAQDESWKARLLLDRVGVHGTSAGGLTALSLAGGQWRVLDLVRHCQKNGEADLGFCYSGMVDSKAQAARRERFEAARGVPELFLPGEMKVVHGGVEPKAGDGDPRMDARVAAVTVAVPAAAILSSESLARVKIPVGVVSAGKDTWLLPEFHAQRLLRECRACAALIDLPTAAHMDLLSPFPAEVARGVASKQPRGGELTPDFDARERAKAFAAIAAFYQRTLPR